MVNLKTWLRKLPIYGRWKNRYNDNDKLKNKLNMSNLEKEKISWQWQAVQFSNKSFQESMKF